MFGSFRLRHWVTPSIQRFTCFHLKASDVIIRGEPQKRPSHETEAHSLSVGVGL